MTISDALHEFEGRGYIGQFAIRPGGLIECVACNGSHRPGNMAIEAMRRIEGASDPADLVFVGALECPNCGARGTATIPYGPNAAADDAYVLRELEQQRPAQRMTQEASDNSEDSSLVRDTGWLRGPDG